MSNETHKTKTIQRIHNEEVLSSISITFECGANDLINPSPTDPGEGPGMEANIKRIALYMQDIVQSCYNLSLANNLSKDIVDALDKTNRDIEDLSRICKTEIFLKQRELCIAEYNAGQYHAKSNFSIFDKVCEEEDDGVPDDELEF